MKTQTLNTHTKVIRKLGGPAALAELTGRKTQAIWNWRKRKRFPPTLYLLMQTELKRRGATAEPKLFCQEERAA